jgi:ribosomal protein S18 acetylase RimI-like enzyme
MPAYRFCRSDDMGFLVAAYEDCRGAEDVAAPPLDRTGFKDLVRELDLWCSSCMVALDGREPVAVLLGAKRAEATLVYGLRVKPEHRRRGHARHLLTSLGQKLAILGPERLVAEVPAERGAACELFLSCGWHEEARLLDWRRPSAAAIAPSSAQDEAVAPIRLEDVMPAALLGSGVRCWERDPVTLAKLGDRVLGLGFHSPERLEAWVLYRPGSTAWEIFAAGLVAAELGRFGFSVLIAELARQAAGTALSWPRWSPGEVEGEHLAALGFAPGAEYVLFATRAQAA